jgi:hypothetical protein
MRTVLIALLLAAGGCASPCQQTETANAVGGLRHAQLGGYALLTMELAGGARDPVWWASRFDEHGHVSWRRPLFTASPSLQSADVLEAQPGTFLFAVGSHMSALTDDGVQQWTTSAVSPQFYFLARSTNALARVIAQDPDPSNPQGLVWYDVRGDGSLRAPRRFDSPGFPLVPQIATSDGGLLAAGDHPTLGSQLVKLGADGRITWQASLKVDLLFELTEGYLVATSPDKVSLELTRVSVDGQRVTPLTTLSDARANAPDHSLSPVGVTTRGLVVTGAIGSSEYLAEYGFNGALLWRNDWDRDWPRDVSINVAAADASGGLAVGGYRPVDNQRCGGSDLVHLAADGSEDWHRTL